ncbi:MAG: VPLPA-CTERM sorting domain-containing protein [Pseudomonadota bacterium]
MKRQIFAIALAAASIMGIGSTQAAQVGVFDLQLEGGGTAQVYQLNNGNYLGLWGFDTRDRKNRRTGLISREFTGGMITTADIAAGFGGSASRIVGYYFGGDSALNNGASEFDVIRGSLQLDAEARYFNSLWIEWTGGTLSFRSISGTRTLGINNATILPGDPLAVSSVPLPAAGWMLLAGLGGLVALKRRRKA